MDFLRQLMGETINSGIVQTVIAFGAWAYIPVLVLVAIYDAVLCLVNGIRNRKR